MDLSGSNRQGVVAVTLELREGAGSRIASMLESIGAGAWEMTAEAWECRFWGVRTVAGVQGTR